MADGGRNPLGEYQFQTKHVKMAIKFHDMNHEGLKGLLLFIDSTSDVKKVKSVNVHIYPHENMICPG